MEQEAAKANEEEELERQKETEEANKKKKAEADAKKQKQAQQEDIQQENYAQKQKTEAENHHEPLNQRKQKLEEEQEDVEQEERVHEHHASRNTISKYSAAPSIVQRDPDSTTICLRCGAVCLPSYKFCPSCGQSCVLTNHLQDIDGKLDKLFDYIHVLETRIENLEHNQK